MSYSAKNSLKVWASNASGPSSASTLALLPVGEVGFFTALGVAIATTGTGNFCYRKADGQILKSKEFTFAAAWKSSIKAYAAPTMQKQTVTVPVATASTFFQIRVEMKLVGMLGEYFKHGNYQSSASGDTTTTIATALAASLNANLAREHKEYFTITSSGADVIIEQKLLPYVLGKKRGRPVAFRAMLSAPEANAVASVLTTAGSDGYGYGPYIAEQEFFAQGYSDELRFGGYPNSFDTRALTAVASGKYDLLALTNSNVQLTANSDVNAPEQYLLAWNSVGVGVVPVIAGGASAPDVSSGTASGTGGPGDTIYLYDNGTAATGTNSALVDANGDWAITSGLTGITNLHTITAIAIAPLGGSSAASVGVAAKT